MIIGNKVLKVNLDENSESLLIDKSISVPIIKNILPKKKPTLKNSESKKLLNFLEDQEKKGNLKKASKKKFVLKSPSEIIPLNKKIGWLKVYKEVRADRKF